MKERPFLTAAAIGLAALLVAAGWGLRGCYDAPDVPDVPVVVVPEVVNTPADRVVYVYEKDDGGIPSAVAAGIDKLNRQDIDATTFEASSTDGDDDVPEQYKIPLDAAKLAGLPALVVMSGDKVLEIVKAPTTAEQILESVK